MSEIKTKSDLSIDPSLPEAKKDQKAPLKETPKSTDLESIYCQNLENILN